MGTDGDGINVLDPGTDRVQHYTHIESDPQTVSSDNIRMIFEDSSGTIWIGTLDSGLNRFDRGTQTFKRYPYGRLAEHALVGRMVTNICECSPTRLLIGTDRGLSEFDPATGFARRMFVGTALDNLTIKTIIPMKSGNLWISTPHGIFCCNIEEESFRQYGAEAGVEAANFYIRSGAVTERGEIYFGGPNGVTVFSPEAIRRNTYVPPVVIQDVTVMNRGVPLTETIRRDGLKLTHKDILLEIEFASLNFTNPDRNRYQFRMLGLENDWQTTAAQRRIRYTSLPPGRYTFQVMGSNNEGIFNDEPAELVIVVTPPLWQTLKFRLASSTCAAILLFLIYAMHMRRLKRENIRLEAEVASRTEALLHLAVTDPLTGLANRRCFSDTYAKEFQRAMRDESYLAVLILDVDHFKKYNDEFGHVEGDKCLREVAQSLGSCVKRPGDLAARYGGEEFILLLPKTSPEGALAIAEDARRKIEALCIRHADAARLDYVTVSVGVASLIPRRGMTSQHPIEQADEALYQAKTAGRNRVAVNI